MIKFYKTGNFPLEFRSRRCLLYFDVSRPSVAAYDVWTPFELLQARSSKHGVRKRTKGNGLYGEFPFGPGKSI